MPGSAIAECKKVVQTLDGAKGLPFRPLLDGKMLEAALERHGVDFRDRVYPPDLTITAFCSQIISKDHSCRDAVVRVNVERSIAGLPEASHATSGFCQARSRLSCDLITDLARQTAIAQENRVPIGWLLKGRHVKMIDGSTLSMPDTLENQAVWPQHGSQEEGVGFPIVRVVGLISLATGAIADFSFGPYQGKETGEHALAREILDSVQSGDIILGDRYYDSYFFIAKILSREADVITRLHGARLSDFRRGEHLGPGDHVVELVKPPRPKWMDQKTYDEMPETLTCREVKTGSTDSEGEEVIVVTTLLNPKKYSKTELAAAYKMRWNVELDLRSIKSVMGMDILSCKTPAMVSKEIWTYILAYNLIRELITRAAIAHDLEPRQISFTAALQHFNAFSPYFSVLLPQEAKRVFDVMLKLIAKNIIGNRPGRSEPRAKKRRPKAHPLLTESRSKAKAKIAESLS